MGRSPGPTKLKKTSITSGVRITKRDISLLQALPDYQVLTTTQIQRLFFPSLSRAQKRLRILSGHGLLRRHYRAVAIGSGSVEAVFYPTVRGAKLIGSIGFETGVTVNPAKRELSDMFLNHTLARNDFRIGLNLACRGRSDTNFVTWKQGKSVARTVTVVHGGQQPSMKKITLIPDGFFELEFKGQKFRYYVEIDRGTTSQPRIRMKLSAYTKLFTQCLLQSNDGTRPFKVLCVTRTQSRLRNMIRSSEKINQGPMSLDLFWFAVDRPNWLDEPNRIMSPIWQRRGKSETESLLNVSGPVWASCHNSAA